MDAAKSHDPVGKSFCYGFWNREMERVRGIEPPYSAWEAAALPLSYTRVHAACAMTLADSSTFATLTQPLA